MDTDHLLIKLTTKSLWQNYIHPYEAEFSKYITQSEYDDIIRYLNEHTRLGIATARWVLISAFLPCIVCSGFSGHEITETGFTTLYITLGCTFATVFAIATTSYIINSGVYLSFVNHINDVNFKYEGRARVKLEQVHTGTTITTTTYSNGGASTSVRQYYDYNIYIYGVSPPSVMNVPQAYAQWNGVNTAYPIGSVTNYAIPPPYQGYPQTNQAFQMQSSPPNQFIPTSRQ
ncbi:hypothetical protein HDV01_002326 [Terramyces sp. JEL0728]|nr:hypothetical protein HDV01_002326 [Terramyces sp. JEL0728]